jgi:hypothetical protein
MKKIVDDWLMIIVGAWLGLLQWCNRNAPHETFSMVLIGGFLLLCFLSEWSKPSSKVSE